MMLSHLFESTTTPIITKVIKFCYSTFLAAGRWRDRIGPPIQLPSPHVPPFLRGVRGDQASKITLNPTQQLPTNPLKTLQHLNIRKPSIHTPLKSRFFLHHIVWLPELTSPDSNLRFVKFCED